MASPAPCDTATLDNSGMILRPVRIDGMHPVRPAVDRLRHGIVASGATGKHPGMTLKLLVLKIVISMQRREFRVGGSVAGAALEVAVAF